jgi:UDP-glucuronate 4-epimerase
MKRDFTFVDDIIEGISRVINLIPQGKADDKTPSAIYNIGNGIPVELMDFIHTLESELGEKAIIDYTPMQAGDVIATWADCSLLERDTGFHPHTALSTGIKKFVNWYKDYYF